jgi:hypothetical protein
MMPRPAHHNQLAARRVVDFLKLRGRGAGRVSARLF